MLQAKIKHKTFHSAKIGHKHKKKKRVRKNICVFSSRSAQKKLKVSCGLSIQEHSKELCISHSVH